MPLYASASQLLSSAPKRTVTSYPLPRMERMANGVRLAVDLPGRPVRFHPWTLIEVAALLESNSPTSRLPASLYFVK